VVFLAGVPAAGTAGDDIYAVRRESRGVVLTNVPPASGSGRLLHDEAHRRRDAAEPRRQAAPSGPRPYADTVRRVADRYGLDQDLVHAVISVESAYDPRAVSPRGAVGLMQLMPATAAELGVHDLTDPHDNIVGGVRHLRRLMDRYDGDLVLSLAAYNAGMAAVDRHGGVPPYRETMDYVRRVRRRYQGDGRAADRHGAEPIYSYEDGSGALVFTHYPSPDARRRGAAKPAR
jgi:soluble lytic murein transglycosylase-like protein